MEKLRDMLIKELQEIGEKPYLTCGDVDMAYKMIDIILDIDKLWMKETK